MIHECTQYLQKKKKLSYNTNKMLPIYKRQIYYEINYTILSQHDFLLNEIWNQKNQFFTYKPTLKNVYISKMLQVGG